MLHKRVVQLLVMCLIGGGGWSFDASASPDANERRDWLKEFDDNNDRRWKGKEIKTFRNHHDKKYSELLRWCGRAVDKPKKFNVSFPSGEKVKKFKCKKNRVDAPYLAAWIKEGKPEKKPDIHPAHPEMAEQYEDEMNKKKSKKKGKQ